METGDYWYSLPDLTLAKCHGFQKSREKAEVCGLWPKNAITPGEGMRWCFTVSPGAQLF